MAVNRYGIDVAQLYRDKENIEASRTRNKMASLQLGEAEREIEQRHVREEEAKKRNVMVAGLKEKAINGDQEARDKLMTIDSTAKEFIDYIDNANAKKVKQSRDNIEQMGGMVNFVKQITDPTEREAKYQQARSMIPQKIQDKWPKNYNENDVNLTLAKLKLMDKIAENKVLSFGDEEILFKNGKEIERTKRQGKSGGKGRLDSTKEIAISKNITSALTGIDMSQPDASQNLASISQSVRDKVTQVTKEVVDLMNRNRDISYSDAKVRVFKKYGFTEPEPLDPVNDILGIL